MEDNLEENSSIDKTLEDGAWLDSFDKILGPRPIMREQNLLKRKVNASYNRDSSVENSVNSLGNSVHQQLNSSIDLSVQCLEKARKSCPISTPVVNKALQLDPFKCSISPVGAWRLLYFNKEKEKKDDKLNFKSTPIRPIIEVVDYDDSVTKKVPQHINISDDSFSMLLKDGNQNYNTLCTSTAEYKNKPVSRTKKPTKASNSTKKLSLRPTNARHVCFELIVDESLKAGGVGKTLTKNINVMNTNEDRKQDEVVEQRVPSLTLQPGKWRKSFMVWRRQQVEKRPTSLNNRQSEHNRNNSVEFVGYVGTVAGHRKSIFIKPERISENLPATTHLPFEGDDRWEERVLRRCQQQFPLPFGQLYCADNMAYCVKIGEGAYGEVFLRATNKRKALHASSTVMKIIPIEGTQEVNGEKQKTYEQILSEVVISMELANLRKAANEQKNITSGFVNVKKISCVKGEYPPHLKKLWNDYDKEKGSENDHPDIFTETQLYIVLELEFCGRDMESFQFQNAEQAFFALLQIVLTLAVAESAYQFEHRDLHWGNVLLLSTSVKELSFTMENQTYVVPTKGVKATLIDYTLSRMTFDNFCHYNDISCDEDLFSATGDYQFDIYRMMRDVLSNNWETFEPRTNIFWISYIITKMIDGVQYKNRRTKAHTTYHTKLTNLMEIVLNYNSAIEFAKYLMELS